MQRLRVALDYRPALLTSAGIGRAVRELARALAARDDVEVHLFAHSLSPAARSDAPPPAAQLHRWPIPGRSLPWLARAGLPAPALCGRPAVFHWTDYVHPPVGRTPAVLTVHDLAFTADAAFHGEESAALLERTRRAAALARLVLVPSHATATAAIAHLGVPEERIRVVPFGADHVPREATANPAPERPYVLALGTIEPRKNHLRLLRAFAQLPEPRPRLVVVGRRGWECDGIVGALRDAERQGLLRWHENLDDDEAFRWLQHAAALVYPSLLEGFGFPPLEALALGTPVVAADVPALRETLGDAARFCDPCDAGSIAQALDEVLRVRGLRAALRERGAARAAQLTWARAAAGHVAAYREATAGQKARAR